MKNKPQYVEWTVNTCPLGCWLRVKTRPLEGVAILTAKSDNGICEGSGVRLTYKELLDMGEHSIDNGLTWKPCGTKIALDNVKLN